MIFLFTCLARLARSSAYPRFQDIPAILRIKQNHRCYKPHLDSGFLLSENHKERVVLWWPGSSRPGLFYIPDAAGFSPLEETWPLISCEKPGWAFHNFHLENCPIVY